MIFETTIMENSAVLAMVQKTIIDTLHKEGKSQRVNTERGGCSRHAVSKHIKCKVDWKEEIGQENVQKQQGWRKLENTVKKSRFKHLGELHKEWMEAGVSASRVTTLRHRHRATKPLLKQKHRQKHLTWAKEKKNWTVAQWSKVLFSYGSKVCISFGNQGPRVWRKSGKAQNPCCLKSSVKFPQSVSLSQMNHPW